MEYLLKKGIFIVVVFGMAVLGSLAKAQSQSLEVNVSSFNLQQGDTVLVVVKNDPDKVSGFLGNVKLRFLQQNNNWIAISGITVDKKLGSYSLKINAAGKNIFQKDVQVLKGDFPETKLAITQNVLKKGYTPNKILKYIENGNAQLDKVLDFIAPVAYFSKPFVNPLSEIKVVQGFGNILKSKNFQTRHMGVDLQASLGTPVLAVNDGRVVFLKNLKNYGNTVVINHGLGIYSLYLHLSKINFAKGKKVKQGDVIGLAGQTGYATGPHLHFSIKMRGASVDPIKFIQATNNLPW